MEQSTGIKGERKLIAFKLHMLNVVCAIHLVETANRSRSENKKQNEEIKTKHFAN